MANKEDIRPIYSQLQGCLSQQAPRTDKIASVDDPNLWKQANQVIDELSKVSGEDYSRFMIMPQVNRGYAWLAIDTYRTTIGGLIYRLHGKYFSDEPAPVSGVPSTVITQTQQQSQSIQVQMNLDFQDYITEKINQLEPGATVVVGS